MMNDISNRRERRLDTSFIQADALDGIDDLGSLGGRLREQRPMVVPKRHNHRQQPVVRRPMAFIELIDVGID